MKHRALILLACALPILLTGCAGRTQMSKQSKIDEKELKGPDLPTLKEALLNSATQAEKAGNYKNAVQYYAQLVEKAPDNKDYQFRLAENLRRTGEYDLASKQYETLENDPKYKIEALEGAGLSLMGKNEFERAGDKFAAVMAIDPKRWRTLNGIALLFTVKGMHDEARQYFEEAKRVAPQNASILNNMALMEALDKQYGQSIQLFQQASQMPEVDQSDRAQIGLNMAMVYAIKGDLNHAEDAARPFLNQEQLYNNMGYYAEIAGDDKMAESYLNMALTQSKTYYAKAWKNLDTLNRLRERAPSRTLKAN